MKKIYLLIILSFLCKLSFAQTSIQWAKLVGTSNFDMINSVQQTTDEGYIAAGTMYSQGGPSTNSLVLKYDSVGNVQWQWPLVWGDDSEAFSVQQTFDGGYIVSNNSDKDLDTSSWYYAPCIGWITKLNSTGILEWETCLTGLLSFDTLGTYNYYWDQSVRPIIKQTFDGGYIVSGSILCCSGWATSPSYGYIAKLNSTGALQWHKMYSNIEWIEDVQQTADGGYIVCGPTKICKLNSSGNIQWTYTNTILYFASIKQTYDGGYISAGYEWLNGIDSAAILKINSSGIMQWVRWLPDARFEDVIQTSDSNYIVLASTSSSNISGYMGGEDVLLVKYNITGNLLWQKCFGYNSDETAYSIKQTADEGFIIGGGSNNSIGFGDFDAMLMKLYPEEHNPSLAFYSKKNDPVNYNGTFLDDKLTFLDNSLSGNTNTFKICADGSKASLFKFTCEGCDLTQIKFRIKSDPTASDTLLFGYFNNFTAYALNVTQDTLLVTFRHPSYLGAGFNQTFRRDTLQLINTSTQEVIFENPLEIYRAPVIFLHGFKSNSSIYDLMAEELTYNNLYPGIGSTFDSPLLHKVDYASSSLARVMVNRKIVPNAIDSVLSTATNYKFSCGNAIVIGHSMGGLLARLYLQSAWSQVVYRGDIQKLITLNTPHYGSQAANYLLHDLTGERLNLVSLFLSLSNATTNINTNYFGAIRDLRVNSDAIMNKVNQTQNNKVPSVTLFTDGAGDFSTGEPTALQVFLYYAINIMNIYDSEINDLIVPLSSQQAGINLTSIVANQWHGSTENSFQISKVIDCINQSPLSTNFTLSGFTIGSLTYNPVVQNPIQKQNLITSTSDIQFTSPNSSQVFNPGDPVTVNITSTPDINHMALFVTGPSISPMVIDTGSVQQLSFSIPAAASGILYLNILGGDSTSWVASDTVTIVVQSTLSPDSIISSPTIINQSLGLISTIDVSGYFGNNNPISLLNNPNLIMNYDTTFLLHVNGLSFQSLDTGSTSIVFTYLGQSDTSYINIFDNPASLSAGFDYSNDVICEGDSVFFLDLSQGLAVSYQWNFPGGNPAQSNQQNPMVVYPSGGSFAVSLKTTFVNGVDSILMDSLIIVNSMPTPVISGNTSFCVGDSTILDAGSGFSSYLWSTNSTNQSITTSMPGLYVVTVTDMNSCSNSTNVTVNINSVDTTVTANGFTLMANAGSASYQWINCADSVFIPGQAGQTFVATQDGNYAVIVSQNGCSDTSNCYTILGTGISIVDHTENISIYPNPTNALLYIHMDGITTSNVNLTLTNPLGQIVNQQILNTDNQAVETEFDLKNLPAGIYFLSVSSNKFAQTFKVQKL